MKYADYSYYLLEYKGKLQEIFFDSLIIKASREIDKNVNTRLTETKINNLPKEAQEALPKRRLKRKATTTLFSGNKPLRRCPAPYTYWQDGWAQQETHPL